MKRLAAASALTGILVWSSMGSGVSDRAASDSGRRRAIEDVLAGRFKWKVGPPLLLPASRPGDPCHAVKDPSIVRYKGLWHLFCTIRSEKRSHQIEYLSFADWKHANAAKRRVLKLTDGYFCAPQVFYFTPHRKWYLICQVIDRSRRPALQPAYSTTVNIAHPTSWTRPKLLFARQPDNVKMWIDFWVICDRTRAHLFFTSLDGRMWRAETSLANFPHGWSPPGMVLRGDIFEASHTYRLRGMRKYLTVVEARAGGRRYYKAYIADRLDGRWRPLAASSRRPFAAASNVRDTAEHWTDSVSHGELIRFDYDQRLQVDPANLRFLFQGVSARAGKGLSYGRIPWKLGMLVPDR